MNWCDDDTIRVRVIGDKIFINDEEFYIPKKVFGCHNLTTINGKVYVNGYELKNGKWKITLRSLFHLFF